MTVAKASPTREPARRVWGAWHYLTLSVPLYATCTLCLLGVIMLLLASDAEDLMHWVQPATLHLDQPPASNVIDYMEDFRGMGYPDARKVVRDGQGNLYVAYRKKAQRVYHIFVAKSRDNGNSWQVLNANQPIEDVGPYTQRVPALAIDGNDRLHLAWYGNDAQNKHDARQIKYARSLPGGAGWTQWADGAFWRSLGDVAGYTTAEDLWQEHPALYVNGANVYVVWEGLDQGHPSGQIKFARSTDSGEHWTGWRNIYPLPKLRFSRPTLMVTYVDAQRYLFVTAYAKLGSGVAQIYWSRSADNGNQWTVWQTVDPGTTDQRHVSLARDSHDRLYLVWRELTSATESMLRYRVYDPALGAGAGDWVAPASTIAAAAGSCLLFPSIALTAGDHVWVSWTQSTAACASLPNEDLRDGQIWLMHKPYGAPWSQPAAITAPAAQGGANVFSVLRRENHPATRSDYLDLVWLDLGNLTTPAQGDPSCNQKGCALRHVALPLPAEPSTVSDLFGGR